MNHQHNHNHHFPVLERMALVGLMMFPPLAASYIILSMFEEAKEKMNQEEKKS